MIDRSKLISKCIDSGRSATPQRISIVDVPGHVDYFKNTIAGFANVDGIIFCIDSVQGWSRQSQR